MRSEGHLIGGMTKVDKELPNPLSIEMMTAGKTGKMMRSNFWVLLVF